MAVCVPVRDENDTLPTLLEALAGQTVAGTFCICLLFDGEQHELVARARAQAIASGLILYSDAIARCSHANAGRARRAALALGLRVTSKNALLLTTDADSCPAPDWIVTNRHALTDADIVAGHIRRTEWPVMPDRDRLEQYYARLYALERHLDPIAYEPQPAHPSLGGASLGFRADVYRALGGFKCLAAREDSELVAAARRAGYRFRRDPAVRVITSARTVGRARGGLADELAQQQTAPDAVRVEHPVDAAARYALGGRARAVFLGARTHLEQANLAEALGWPKERLNETLAAAPSADAFTLGVVASPALPRMVDLATAESALQCLSDKYGLSVDD